MNRLEQLLVGIVFYLATSGIVDATGIKPVAATAAPPAPFARVVAYGDVLGYSQSPSFSELVKRMPGEAWSAVTQADEPEQGGYPDTAMAVSARPSAAAAEPAIAAAADPKPSSWVMLAVGLVVAGFMARRISGAGSL